MVNLFIEPVKIASSGLGLGLTTKLEGNADTWSEQIMGALYEEHPFMLDLQPSLQITRMDPDAGYLLGVITFGSTETPSKILVAVQDKLVLPFATFVHDGMAYPLTETRVGEILTNTPHETAVKSDNVALREVMQDQDMSPPEHLSAMGGMGNRIISSKLADTSAIIDGFLDALAPEWAEDVRPRYKTVLAKMHPLLVNPESNAGVKLHNKVVAQPPVVNPSPNIPTPAENEAAQGEAFKQANAYGEYHDTFMVAPGRGSRLRVTSTSNTFRKVASVEMSKFAAAQTFGKDFSSIVKDIARAGYAVRSNRPIKLAMKIGGDASVVDEPGVWAVKKTTGESLTGTVYPNVVDFGGTLLPLQIFTSGVASAVQDAIAGEFIAEDVYPREDDAPSGESVFVFKDDAGRPACTIPFAVSVNIPTPYGEAIVVETYLGDKLRLVRMAVAKPAPLDDRTYAIPSHYILQNIGDPMKRCSLIATTDGYDAMQKVGSREVLTLRGDGEYNLQGSGYDLRDMTPAATHMHLASMGAPNPAGLMKRASFLGQAVSLYGAIDSDHTSEVEEKLDVLQKHARAVFDNIRPDPASLVKISAWILRHPQTIDTSDFSKKADLAPETVDSILSLGFVTPENTRRFVASISDFEDTSKKLASLVIASQLGYSEIPMEETISAMRSVESVLGGLRRLKAQVI